MPRDLSEVGPEQRQFRSSVQLFGRVENTNIIIDPTNNLGAANTQYYPERSSDTVSTISTVVDLFEYTTIGDTAPRPNYFPQFYSVDSNPLIAKISTNKKIGQISTTNYDPVTATVGVSATTNIIQVANVSGDVSTIVIGSKVSGPGFPEDLEVSGSAWTPPSSPVTITTATATTNNTITTNSPVPANNSSVVGLGIPDGTIIISSNSSVSPKVITLNNVVNVNAGIDVDVSTLGKIEVNKSVSVTRGKDIVVTGEELPGIQYLAVYETKPEESLLDIFWETSTSGLIEDLNNAVLNESSGGADLFGFNPTPFNEGIQDGDNVSSSSIFIVDNFGIQVPVSSINSPLEIVSQKNSVTPIPEDVDYFELYEVVPGTNEYNIRVNTNYFNNIFFDNNDELRKFTINLQTTVNDLVTPFSIQLDLANLSPTISSPSPGEEILVTPSITDITTIICQNGSGNVNLSNVLNENNVEIVSIINSSGENITQSGFFELNNAYQNPNGNFEITLFNAQGIFIPADRYEFTVRVTDAGGENDSAEVDFVVDFGVRVEDVKTYRYFTYAYRPLNPNAALKGPATTGRVYQYYTTFKVTEGPVAAQGWYLYNGPWSTGIPGIVAGPQGFNDLSITYAGQPWNSDNTAVYPSFPELCYVGPLIEGGDNTGFGTGFTGGGINRVGNNLTILGGPSDVNLPFGRTGARMLRASFIQGEEELHSQWRTNCKYIRDQEGSVFKGIYTQSSSLIIFIDADLQATANIPQEEVDQYRWNVEL